MKVDPQEPKIDPSALRDLLKVAIDEFRYRHSDVWRGQQFYTTVNTSILGFAVALSHFGTSNPTGSMAAIAFLFVIGAIISLFGLATIIRLRVYFLESQAHVAMIERLLHHHTPLEMAGLERLNLAFPFTKHSHKDELLWKDVKLWVRNRLYDRGVTMYFMLLQIIFLVLNGAGIVLVLTGIL